MVKKIADDLGIPFGYLNCDQLDVLASLQNADNSEALKLAIGNQKLVIIDEAQRVKNIGLKLKLMVDNYPDLQIIATGSSSFDLANEIKEPLTGRNFEFWLFPLSIDELFDKNQSIEANRQLEALMIYGSYPDVYQLSSNGQKAERIKYLAANYLYKDILAFKGLKNPDLVLKILQALALQIGSEVSYTELASLVQTTKETVARYVDLLEKAFIIFRLSPYSWNLRKAIGKMKKIYFLDLGIRNALINAQNPLSLRDDVGRLWENFIVSEKFKKQLGLGFSTNYYFWRTYDKQEVDLVEDKGGRLYGWEIKWNDKKARQPSAWKAYPTSSWKLINRYNFLSELV